MKGFRYAMVALLVVLMLGCAACGKKTNQAAQATTVPAGTTSLEATTETVPVLEKFPEDAVILGTSVGGMTPEEALEAVNTMIIAYSMEATVNSNKFVIKAEEVGLKITIDSINAYLQALEADGSNAEAPVAEFDSELLRQRIADGTNTTVMDAKISYSASAQSFQITKERSGVQVDTAAAEEALKPALQTLAPAGSAQVDVRETEPTIKSDDPRLQSGMAKANEYLQISLTYTYAPEQTAAKSQAVSRNDIGSMISIGADMEPYVSSEGVAKYVNQMYKKYSVWGKFTTTTGVELSIPGANAIQGLNKTAMEADLLECLKNRTSGTRTAPYLPRGTGSDYNFEGNYVEVDLSGQCMWVYKNGACVLTTPIVSGNVANNWETITGCYSIYAKTRNATLVGPGYATPVKYWMPFSGGYGLHDASWRSKFGGTEYLYNGSHGCVNIPPANAGVVFDNVSVGTPVVLYGGATEAKRDPQKLTGTLQYKKTPDDAPFALDITGLGTPTFTYESDNPKVAEVSITGQVTIKGVGTANITVTAPDHDRYSKGTVTVTVTVAYDCSKGHNMTWVTTKEPTCVAGEKVGTCKCGHKQTQPVAATKEHSYAWTQTTAPTCKPGEEAGTCTVCGATTTRTVAAIQEHAYGQWTTTQTPTCNAEGVQSSTCTGCGDTKTQSVPKDEQNHSFAEGEFCANGCGTANPGYVPPVTPTPDPSEPKQEEQTP